MFKKIAVAVAFSPRCEALLSESFRLKQLFEAELVLIHIGEKTQKEEEEMETKLRNVGKGLQDAQLIWEKGDPADKILSICRKENVDLLLAGALKKEDLLTHYVGSIARKILRKARCSVFMMTNPCIESRKIQNIVIQGEHSPYVEKAIEAGCLIAKLQGSKQIHILRELKMYGLTMSVAAEQSEEEYSDTKKQLLSEEIKKVEELLAKFDTEGLKINIKVTAGKSGYELGSFAQKINADLIVAGAPTAHWGFLARVFPHDLEYIFAEMPCDVLVVQS